MIQIQRLKHLSSGTLQSLKTGEFPKEMEDRREEYVEMFKERMYEWWTEGTSSKEKWEIEDAASSRKQQRRRRK